MPNKLTSTQGPIDTVASSSESNNCQSSYGPGKPASIRLLWALLDQGTFALANFLSNVMLARSLSSSQYGAFNVCFSFLLLVGSIHSSFLIEPYLVFGVTKHSRNLRSYQRLLLKSHIWLSPVLLLIGLSISFCIEILNKPGIAFMTATLSLAAPAILFQWLTRRLTYLNPGPRTAAIAGFCYLILVSVSLSLLQRMHQLSVESALLCLALNSLVSGLLIVAVLSNKVKSSNQAFPEDEALWDHVHFGRWTIGASIADFLCMQFLYILTPALSTLSASGKLRVIANPIMPIYLVVTSLSLLLRSHFAQARLGNCLKAQFRKWLLITLLASGAYSVAMTLFGKTVLSLLYRNQYASEAGWLAMMSLNPMILGAAEVLGASAASNNRPSEIFRANAVSVVVSLCTALVLIPRLAEGGAVIAMIAGSVFRVMVLALNKTWESVADV